MSKDKNTEIMELARELCGEGEQHQDCFHCPTLRCCGAQKFARELYGKRWRKQSEGEWVRTDWGGKVCSCCNTPVNYMSKFCPNCGAKMKGGT